MGVEVVPTHTLLTELKSWLGRFVSLRDDHQALTLALYVLHTYCLQAAGVTPYLIILSPERRCGKTLLLASIHRGGRRVLSGPERRMTSCAGL